LIRLPQTLWDDGAAHTHTHTQFNHNFLLDVESSGIYEDDYE